MSQEKPKRRWYQFSLRGMFVATTWIAVAFGFYNLPAWLPQYDESHVVHYFVSTASGLSLWFASMAIGAGIGSLCGRVKQGILVGAIILPLAAICYLLSRVDLSLC